MENSELLENIIRSEKEMMRIEEKLRQLNKMRGSINTTFSILCNKCGAVIKLSEECGQEGAEEGHNEKISWFISCYETLDIKCKCGNKRE